MSFQVKYLVFILVALFVAHSLLTHSTTPASRTRGVSLQDVSTEVLLDALAVRLSSQNTSGRGQMPLKLAQRRANAVIVMLARNTEINEVADSMRQLEDRFNGEYGYPWVFLNDEPFSEDFIR